MGNRDLFDELKKIVHCDYISDLRYDPWMKKAKTAIANMDLSKYSIIWGSQMEMSVQLRNRKRCGGKAFAERRDAELRMYCKGDAKGRARR